MNRIVKGLLYLVAALAAGVAGATTIAVGPGDDLKAKVEAAASEDVVEVAEGTYTIGSVDLDGNGRITGFSTRKRTKCLPDLGCYESPWGVPGLLLWVR